MPKNQAIQLSEERKVRIVWDANQTMTNHHQLIMKTTYGKSKRNKK